MSDVKVSEDVREYSRALGAEVDEHMVRHMTVEEYIRAMYGRTILNGNAYVLGIRHNVASRAIMANVWESNYEQTAERLGLI